MARNMRTRLNVAMHPVYKLRSGNNMLILIFISCLLLEVTNSESAQNSKSSEIKSPTRERHRITSLGVTMNSSRRITNTLRTRNPHRTARDTRRIALNDESKMATFYSRRFSDDSPWTANTYASQSSPPFQHSESMHNFKVSTKRTAPANQMLTVVKTYGPKAVQVVEPKDFYKSVYGTETSLRSLKSYNGATNLTQAKLVHGVDQELEDVGLANEHFLRMRKFGRCHLPTAEIVCVKEFYPSDTKEFLPRCTMLHRCSDKSGCCDSDGHKCTAKLIQEVSLTFYTVLSSSRASEANVASAVEKLLFENHTECECMPVDDVATIATTTPTTTTTAMTTEMSTTTTTTENNLDQKPQKDHHSYPGSSHKKCRECPEPFYYREYPDGRCSCDCFDKHKPCIKVKRGREPLLEGERRCVETGRCHIPDCEYGKYDYATGRCPKRPEHAQKGNKNDKNSNHDNHRWNFIERD